MWPRALNIETTGGQGSEPGAHVITPFYCEELGQFVLVNRGWVPRRKMDPSTRPKGQVRTLSLSQNLIQHFMVHSYYGL